MMLSGLFQDLRGGARLLARSPGFTLIAVLSLAIGIGANTATFSFADGLLLRPLPVPDPDEVISVGSINVATGGNDILLASYPDYVDLRDATESFAGGLTAFEHLTVQLAENAEATPEIRTTTLVSGNFFSVMGVTPAFGRVFRPDEDQVPGRDAVAVLSHGFWERSFAADPSVLGRRVRLNGIEFTVIGVTSEPFTGPDFLVQPDLYVPLMMWPTLVGDQPSPLEQRDRRGIDIKGRLRAGVTLEQAGADVARIGAALAQEYPATNAGYEMRVRTELGNRLAEGEFFVAAIAMLALLGAVILLVACVNVAGLLTSRAPAREGEIALRLSIGAGRGRIIRQLLTESLLLALAGAAAGVAVGYLGVLLWRQMPLDDELAVELVFQLDRRVLLATFVVAVGSVFLFGLMPALRASRASLSGVLRTTGGGMAARTGWGRSTLVVVQVALSLVFIAVTSFIYSSFLRQIAAGPGVRTEGILAMSFNTELARLGAADAERFFERLAERAREVPGVEAAALASYIPMSLSAGIGETRIAPEGYEFPVGIESESVLTSYVDADFFGVMDIPLAQGRAFATSDTLDAPRVAIINQALANQFWPGESPVGRRFRAGGLWV
ncbi:MAG TPA: ABC transporter permease, partial [Gammaproteobacteria bacterium]